jgi:sugar porter (SP) family MFS transporter
MSNSILSDKRRKYILFLMFFGGLGGLLYGYDIGVIAGALLFMHKDISLTPAETSLVVGAVLGGGAFATLITGPIADYIGRKKSILASSLIFLAGVLILVNAHDFFTVLLGRIIQGAGIGMEIILIPLYLAETTPPEIRGKSVTLFQLFLTMGIVLAYGINILFAPSQNWRGMFLCVMVPGILFFLGALIISESPRWLFLKNHSQAALKALLRTRNEHDAKKDLHNMQLMDDKGKIAHKENSSVWQARYIKPLLIALAIACLNQLTGINSLLQYGTLILKHSGMSTNLGSMLGSVGVGLMNMIVTIIAVMLIDKVGRKPLLMLGSGCTVLALSFLGLVGYFGHNGPTEGYLMLSGFIFYIVSYAIGPGVVVWLAISELIPTRIRSKGMAICLFANSAVSAVLASVFLIVVKHLGLAGAFGICAMFTFFYFLIAAYALPETKNKSLEDIEDHFTATTGR